MLPNTQPGLESAARTVRDRMGRAGRFAQPPSWPRGRGPTPNRSRH